MRNAILLLVLAAAGCSEDPLDPDEIGEIETIFNPSCDTVCKKLATCGPLDHGQCVDQCDARSTQETRVCLMQVTCDQLGQCQ